MKDLIKIKSISELHKFLGLPKPKNPRITVIDSAKANPQINYIGKKFVLDFYMITLNNHNSEMLYGRNYYDFEEGSLIFMSPGQVKSFHHLRYQLKKQKMAGLFTFNQILFRIQN